MPDDQCTFGLLHFTDIFCTRCGISIGVGYLEVWDTYKCGILETPNHILNRYKPR